jgi:hypothetical protein
MQAQFLKITGKYAFIFMGMTLQEVYYKYAHNSQETAHSAILLHDRNCPGGGESHIPATEACVGKIKGSVQKAYRQKMLHCRCG